MDLNYVSKMLAEGHTYSSIARELSVSRQAVHSFCKNRKLEKQQKVVLETDKQKKKRAFILGENLYYVAKEKFRRKRQNVIAAKKWDWNLCFEDIDWVSHCPILGLELLYESPFDKKTEASVSFDRIDSSKGYVKGNVQIISWRANRIKNDGTAEEHRKIADFLDKMVM